MPFTSLGLGPDITRALADEGYAEPTPIQAKAIPLVLAGRDVIGVAQTGTGKTAAFVLPLLEQLRAAPRHRGMRALIVAPTRELAVQIEESIRTYGRHLGLRSATVYGGVGEKNQIAALKRGADFVVATPGRLLDLMGQRHVDTTHLLCLVLDEADRMLDMGFLPAIRRIVASLPKKRQTLLFSATLSADIERIAQEFLASPVVAQIGARSTPAEAVAQAVVEVSKDDKLEALLHLLKDAALEMVLVFSRTKHGADKLARKLTAAGIATATLHSNRTQGQRMVALKRFRSGEVRVLVATDIAARGIDVDGISHVINFDFPPQPEDYVHRIGRTGRAHAIGDAISFITPEDRGTLLALERFLGRGLPRHHLEGLVRRVRTAEPPRPPERPADGRFPARGGHTPGRGGHPSPPGGPASRREGQAPGRGGVAPGRGGGGPGRDARGRDARGGGPPSQGRVGTGTRREDSRSRPPRRRS